MSGACRGTGAHLRPARQHGQRNSAAAHQCISVIEAGSKGDNIERVVQGKGQILCGVNGNIGFAFDETGVKRIGKEVHLDRLEQGDILVEVAKGVNAVCALGNAWQAGHHFLGLATSQPA